jgi:hypothetical protein
MKWILCYQTPNDSVKFQTDISDEISYLKYKDFIGYVSQYRIKDHAGFIDMLDHFYTLFIDIENQKWYRYQPTFDTPTFEELIALNDKDNKKNLTILDKAKAFIDNFAIRRKEEKFGKVGEKDNVQKVSHR